MKKIRNAVVLFLAVILLSVLTPPVAAEATAGRPITCGMVVQEDAHLYLARDLSCTTAFGVRVSQEQSEPGPVPNVQIDLRGHTLTGPGTGIGIANFGYPGAAYTQVRNGRVKGWRIGVGGDTEVRVRNVALVNNEYGFFCNGNCYLDRSYVSGNSVAGLENGGESNTLVSRTTFVKNRIGAETGYIYPLAISDSVFLKNDVGVQATLGSVTVSHSLFVKNRVGVLVTDDGVGTSCATLSRNIFVRNGTNLDGTRC